MKINTINRIAWLIFLIDQIKHTRCVEEVAEIDNFGNGDAVHYGTDLHRLAEAEDSENKDAARSGTAFHKPVVKPIASLYILIREE